MKRIIALSLVAICASFQSEASDNNVNHAALSVDRSNGYYYGWSYNYPTREEAADKAKLECENAGGDNCAVVLEFSGGGYGYYYTVSAEDGTAYGWAAYKDRESAQSRALNECQTRANGKACSNFVWASNSDSDDDFELLSNASRGLCYGIVYKNCDTNTSKSFRKQHNLPSGVRIWTRPFTFEAPICYDTSFNVDHGELKEGGSRSLKSRPEVVSAVIALDSELGNIMERDAPRICDDMWDTIMRSWVSLDDMRKYLDAENDHDLTPGYGSARIYKDVTVPFATGYIDYEMKKGLNWN
nr:DUF4189 domain-containing protein [uncultured Cohaesibacter sp.]